MAFAAAYLRLSEIEWRRRLAETRELLRSCRVCPRHCDANRLEGKVGACQVGAEPMVSSYGPHFGEEAPLVGEGGSGTIFLTSCNLRCIFCQNYDISHLAQGAEVTVEALARMMVSLQQQGCHNINWVSPTHQVPALLAGLEVARRQGLRRPIVYNTGGYDSVATLRRLDGVVDIYMPDAKYSDNAVGERLTGVADYWDRCREALTEMHRQVGDLTLEDGLAVRGMLVRHLVLPEGQGGTAEVMRFLASLSRDTYVNVMAQYRPCYEASTVREIDRRPTRAELEAAVEAALDAGLHRLDQRRRVAWS